MCHGARYMRHLIVEEYYIQNPDRHIVYRNWGSWIFANSLSLFSYPSVLTCVFGAQKNCFIEMVLLSDHNIYFEWKKLIYYALLSEGLFFCEIMVNMSWLSVSIRCLLVSPIYHSYFLQEVKLFAAENPRINFLQPDSNTKDSKSWAYLKEFWRRYNMHGATSSGLFT